MAEKAKNICTEEELLRQFDLMVAEDNACAAGVVYQVLCLDSVREEVIIAIDKAVEHIRDNDRKRIYEEFLAQQCSVDWEQDKLSTLKVCLPSEFNDKLEKYRELLRQDTDEILFQDVLEKKRIVVAFEMLKRYRMFLKRISYEDVMLQRINGVYFRLYGPDSGKKMQEFVVASCDICKVYSLLEQELQKGNLEQEMFFEFLYLIAECYDEILRYCFNAKAEMKQKYKEELVRPVAIWLHENNISAREMRKRNRESFWDHVSMITIK